MELILQGRLERLEIKSGNSIILNMRNVWSGGKMNLEVRGWREEDVRRSDGGGSVGRYLGISCWGGERGDCKSI